MWEAIILTKAVNQVIYVTDVQYVTDCSLFTGRESKKRMTIYIMKQYFVTLWQREGGFWNTNLGLMSLHFFSYWLGKWWNDRIYLIPYVYTTCNLERIRVWCQRKMATVWIGSMKSKISTGQSGLSAFSTTVRKHLWPDCVHWTEMYRHWLYLKKMMTPLFFQSLDMQLVNRWLFSVDPSLLIIQLVVSTGVS